MLQTRPDRHITPRRHDKFSLAAADRIRIAVLVPCYNEEPAVARVVAGFRASLPDAVVHVYDNNSRIARGLPRSDAGAVVRRESLQGKGHVVRRMFADVEADVYVLVDGDDTYDAEAAPAMVRMLMENQLDMVTAVRCRRATMPIGPVIGSATGCSEFAGLPVVFGNRVSDMLSGYRVFSRRFVKSFPALAAGFETETEFTIHALELRMPIGEVPTTLPRPLRRLRSKLHTYLDGLRILRTIMKLVKQERPLQTFGLTAAMLLAVGLGLGLPVVTEFLHTGLVPRLPTAVLATGLVLAASLAFCLRPRAGSGGSRAERAEAAGLSVDPRNRQRTMTMRHVAGAPSAPDRRLRRGCRDPVAGSGHRDCGGDPIRPGADRRVATRVHRRSGVPAGRLAHLAASSPAEPMPR